MNKLRVFVLLLFFFTGSSLVSGQEVLYLSLDSAQQYALEYNITLKNAGLAVDEADKMVWEMVAGGLPQVDASFSILLYTMLDMINSGRLLCP